MKKTPFFRLLPLLFSSVVSVLTAQINPIPVPKSYENTSDTVKQFFKGDVIAIETDSVYLLNALRFKHYQLLMKFKVAVSQDNANIQKIFNDLVQSVTTNLASLEKLNREMKINADSTSAIGHRLADITYKNALRADSVLALAKARLDTAQARLDTADAHLAKAVKLIDKERRQRWWRNIKWATIGVGVGILIRSFVIKKP